MNSTTRIRNIWYMEPGPAQAEIVYFVLYRLAQFPSEITVMIWIKHTGYTAENTFEIEIWKFWQEINIRTPEEGKLRIHFSIWSYCVEPERTKFKQCWRITCLRSKRRSLRKRVFCVHLLAQCPYTICVIFSDVYLFFTILASSNVEIFFEHDYIIDTRRRRII